MRAQFTIELKLFSILVKHKAIFIGIVSFGAK